MVELDLDDPDRVFVFGYGALVDPDELRATLARETIGSEPLPLVGLQGYRRAWSVAMDNRPEVTADKYYLDPETGEQPPVFVTYLDVVQTGDAAVNGVLVPVGERELETLDRRERNYDRVEVTARITARVAGTVWAYVGKEEARRRFDRAREENRAVINASYRSTVRAAFADRGEEALQTYVATTRPPEVPERPLRRIVETPS